MHLEEWLVRNERGSVAIIHGGRSHDILDTLLKMFPARSTVIADRALAAALAPAVAMRNRPHVDVHLSRGYLRDFDQQMPIGSGGPIVLPASVMEDDVTCEMRRTSDQIQILAGYPAPPEIISRIVNYRFTTALRRCQQRRKSAVVVHDRTGWLNVDGLDKPHVFSVGESTENNMSFALDQLQRDFRPPTIEDLTRQSEYMVRTELPVLIDMHAWIAGPAAGDLFAYWSEQLSQAKSSRGHELFAVFAQEKIAELADAFNLSQVG